MRLVLDASVAIAAARIHEPSSVAARGRIGRAFRRQDDLVLPALFGIEVAGALSRHGEPEDKIRDYVARLTSPPHEVIPLGVSRARRALDVALTGRLRGADAVYVWLASSRGLPLCTLDHEMAERAEAFCKVIEPVRWRGRSRYDGTIGRREREVRDHVVLRELGGEVAQALAFRVGEESCRH